jgi:hypothetical protein
MGDLGIWLVGFSPSTATLHLGDSPKTTIGWEKQLLLVAPAALTRPITLRIESVVGSAGEVWLSRGGVQQATATLTFDAGTAQTSITGKWHSWPFAVFIAAAGCYYVDLYYGGIQSSGTFVAAGW